MKNLFATKTFYGALIGMAAAIAPVGIKCSYEHRAPTEAEALILFGATTTFGWALTGRTQGAAYTPDWLPGPNKPPATMP